MDWHCLCFYRSASCSFCCLWISCLKCKQFFDLVLLEAFMRLKHEILLGFFLNIYRVDQEWEHQPLGSYKSSIFQVYIDIVARSWSRGEGLQHTPATRNAIGNVTARLPTNTAGCEEPAKRKADPKTLNLPSRVKTFISCNSYWLRETDRQISLELSNSIPSQKVAFKMAKLIWIRGQANGRARARSFCRAAQRCLHTQ